MYGRNFWGVGENGSVMDTDTVLKCAGYESVYRIPLTQDEISGRLLCSLRWNFGCQNLQNFFNSWANYIFSIKHHLAVKSYSTCGDNRKLASALKSHRWKAKLLWKKSEYKSSNYWPVFIKKRNMWAFEMAILCACLVRACACVRVCVLNTVTQLLQTWRQSKLKLYLKNVMHP
jgi:hypothetical protein